MASTGTDEDWAGAIRVGEMFNDLASLKQTVESLVKGLNQKGRGRKR